MDGTFFQACIWHCARADGWDWMVYKKNAKTIAHGFTQDSQKYRTIVGSECRVANLQLWLQQLQEQNIKVYMLTANFKEACIPFLKKMNVLQYFETPLYDRRDLGSNGVISGKADLMSKHRGQDTILFLDDSSRNIEKAKEANIPCIHIDTDCGITKRIQEQVLKFF